MFSIRSLGACGIFAATLWSAADADAGGCGCGRTYRAPVYYQPIVHVHRHGGPMGPGHDDHDHGGGPGGGGQGIGGPGGQGVDGPGGAGPGGGGQGGGGQGGQQGFGGQNGQGQNGQGQLGQNQNGQNQNGQNQSGQNQNGQGQNGQNQNGQNQLTQNQNGQNQNGANVQAVQVPAGAQVTLTGSYGADGEVYLNINNVKLPLVVEQWTDNGITLTLPAVKLTQAQSATIDVVAKNGKTDSIAITLNPQAKLVVNNQQKPANQGGGNGNANAGNVAGVQ
jgi:hypothetical protein